MPSITLPLQLIAFTNVQFLARCQGLSFKITNYFKVEQNFPFLCKNGKFKFEKLAKFAQNTYEMESSESTNKANRFFANERISGNCFF